jgi:hypothetical protein
MAAEFMPWLRGRYLLWLRCRECEEELRAHRIEFGTCYLCQAAREMRIRRMGAGA